MSATIFDTHGLPLDPHSPWPKFRANAAQTGVSPVEPLPNHREPWTLRTGKGIFSSPVVDGDGTVYIGSADHIFYAIDRDGNVKWTLSTDEIIDSSAILDDEGRVYFASGDSHVYCAARDTGRLLWRSKAHTVQEVETLFNIDTYNLAWFEGNVGMLPDGSIIAPNDNYIVYRMDAETGEKCAFYPANEMVWSLPAVNPETERMFFGTCFMLNENLFCYNYKSGEKLWSAGGFGSVSASPLLTNAGGRPAVIAGCFDGFLRAFAQEDGELLWETGLGDHIYASPARLSTGEIIQPCADGGLYCLNPDTGVINWVFDTLEPIRSSPAIDGRDQIYFGNGEGKLFCVNPEGSLRWWYKCILDPRCDMNASPALGFDGVYIAGESGEIFFVPYDYPLRAENASNPRCKSGPVGDLPDEGVFFMYTGQFGEKKHTLPEAIVPNAPLTFSFMIRKGGKTLLSALNSQDFTVVTDNGDELEAVVAANGRFVCVYPTKDWSGDILTLRIKGSYTLNLEREGLYFFGGEKGGEIDQAFTFRLHRAAPRPFPFSVPDAQDGGSSTVIELCRQAVPLPTMMPSLNQIGFDSLHYLAGLVEKRGDTALLWVVSGKLVEKDGTAVFDPSSAVRYPMLLRAEGGSFTLYNFDGFKINFVGSWDMPFEKYYIAASLDNQGDFDGDAAFVAVCDCDKIEFYGPGLKMMGLSDMDTGIMCAYGGLTLRRRDELTAPDDLGDVTAEPMDRGVRAIIKDSALKADGHVFSLLLTDVNGSPLPLYYTQNTAVKAAADGTLSGIELSFEPDETVEGDITLRLMVDTYPAFTANMKL